MGSGDIDWYDVIGGVEVVYVGEGGKGKIGGDCCNGNGYCLYWKLGGGWYWYILFLLLLFVCVVVFVNGGFLFLGLVYEVCFKRMLVFLI